MFILVIYKLYLFFILVNKEKNGKFWFCVEYFINFECKINIKVNYYRKYGYEEVL